MSKSNNTVADLMAQNRMSGPSFYNGPTGSSPANSPYKEAEAQYPSSPPPNLLQVSSSKPAIYSVSLTLNPHNVEIIDRLLLYKTQVVAFSELDVPNIIGLKVRKE